MVIIIIISLFQFPIFQLLFAWLFITEWLSSYVYEIVIILLESSYVYDLEKIPI